jgi:hypothetical protein
MIDDRICMFYVADRLDEIWKSKDLRGGVLDFLSEMNHNIGVNTRIKRATPEEFVEVPVKRKRGRPRKNP